MITAGEFPVLVDYILIAAVLLGIAARCAWRAARALKQHRWPPEVHAAIDAEDSAIDHARTVLQESR
jgi:hypothetical protein